MNTIFLRLWLAIFLTGAGTFLLLMMLSARVMSETGSIFLANSVVLTVWLPAVLAVPVIRAIVKRFAPRSILIGSELGSLITVPLLFVLLSNPVLLMLILTVKGLFDSLSKVSRTTAIKQYFSGDALDKAASYYNTASLAGIGVGALVAALLEGRLDIRVVLGLGAALHLASALIYLSLPSTAKPVITAAEDNSPSPLRDWVLFSAVVYFVCTVGIFQGYLNIARSAYPIKILGLTESSIGFVQAITSIAYVVGAFFAAQIRLTKERYSRVAGIVHWLVLVVLAPLPWITSSLPGLSVYALYALLFEAAYCVHMRYIILAAPASQIGKVVANANAAAIGLMMVFSLIGSYAEEFIGLNNVTWCAVAVAILVFAFIRLRVVSAVRQEGF